MLFRSHAGLPTRLRRRGEKCERQQRRENCGCAGDADEIFGERKFRRFGRVHGVWKKLDAMSRMKLDTPGEVKRRTRHQRTTVRRWIRDARAMPNPAPRSADLRSGAAVRVWSAASSRRFCAGDLSPSKLRDVWSHTRVPPLARAVSAPLNSRAPENPTATSRLAKAVTSPRTPKIGAPNSDVFTAVRPDSQGRAGGGAIAARRRGRWAH